MTNRMVEIILPDERQESLAQWLTENLEQEVTVWYSPLQQNTFSARILLDNGDVERVAEGLDKRFNLGGPFQLLVWPVAQSIGQARPGAPDQGEANKAGKGAHGAEGPQRLSREELTNRAMAISSLSPDFLALTLLATVVAVVGLYRANPVIILAAMVIAPLLGPCMALSLATTLLSERLAKQGLVSLAAGSVLSVLVAYVVGLGFPVSPSNAEIAARTVVEPADIILALGSGAAGTLCFALGMGDALIGVMVAMSLLPPLATAGLLLGSGFMWQAMGAVVLFGVNVICLNLAGIVTFLLKGLLPSQWWKAEDAKRQSMHLLLGWLALLLVVALGWWRLRGDLPF